MFISTPHIVFLIYTQNIDWFLRRVLYIYKYIYNIYIYIDIILVWKHLTYGLDILESLNFLRHCPRSLKKESQWWKLQGLIDIATLRCVIEIVNCKDVKITDGGENMKECEISVKSEPHPLAVTQWHWVKSGHQKRQLGGVQATPGMHVDFLVFRKDKDWHYKCWKHCQPCFYTWPSTTFQGCMKPTWNGLEAIHVFMSLPSLMRNILHKDRRSYRKWQAVAKQLHSFPARRGVGGETLELVELTRP